MERSSCRGIGNVSSAATVGHKTMLRTEANPKWIRAFRDGETVVDSHSVMYAWEHEYYPYWYIPEADVAADLLSSSDATSTNPDVPGHVKVNFDAVDHWFEEDIEVFVHPRDPYKRIDALRSSRDVVVKVDGVVVADTHSPTLLYETSLPVRYYLPATDVRLEHLTPTDNSSACPYKGWASYWSVSINEAKHENIAWSYATPLPESAAIAGLICFYNEKVDIEVDGDLLERPDSPFS